MIITFFNFCSEEKPTEQLTSKEKSVLHKTNEAGDKINFSITGDSTKTDSVKIKDKEKDKNKWKGGGITPNAQSQCQIQRASWRFDHYENVPGKIVGIWPTNERWSNVARLKQLKDTLGFNYILTMLGWPYDNVISAGYNTINLLGGGFDIVVGGYIEAILSRPPLWGYYTDEPLSKQGGTVSQMENYANSIRSVYPYSILIAGENIVSNADAINHTVSIITCTRYENYPEWYDTDQRPLWTNFRQHFNEQFNMVWIGAHKDLGQYDDLINHALNLGISAIWLYQYEDLTDTYSNNNVETFAYYSWKWGYLTRVERKWIYVYECQNQDPCDCNPNYLSGEWILVNKYPTWETRTVSY